MPTHPFLALEKEVRVLTMSGIWNDKKHPENKSDQDSSLPSPHRFFQ